jgi:predicted ATPase/DNA-binding CsgD family transcriptional regulator
VNTAKSWDLSHNETLNRREVEILRLIKEGLSNKDIAQQLFLTVETVKWYNQQIYSKLGVNSRTQAVEKAIEAGLIQSAGDLPFVEPARLPSNRPKHNLPASLSTFIGRSKERADLRGLMHAPNARLITIRGPGGMGKTRLALLAAEDAYTAFEHGAWWVDLAPITDPAQIAQVVVRALGIEAHEQVANEEILLQFLSERALLLVLDNCEHLVETCARLVTLLLTGCSNLHILATSREPLGVSGEVQYPLLPLNFPDPQHLPALEAVSQCDAVQMLVERIGRVTPGYTLTQQNALALTKICQRLDGMPLALELIAARANFLSVEQIAARLEEGVSLLATSSRSRDPRHQTMKLVLDWSFDLLFKTEKLVLQRLAIFTGGWTLAAAESVCSFGGLFQNSDVLDLLNSLVNKSMVVVESQQSHETRCRLLEPIRQYLVEKLTQSGEVAVLKDRHLDYYLSLALQAETHLVTHQAVNWFERLSDDLYNLRAALSWSLKHLDQREEPVLQSAPNRLEKGLQLATALNTFWLMRNHCPEGVEWLRRLLGAQREREASQSLTLAGRAARGRALNILWNLIHGADTWWTSIAPTPEEGRLGLLAESETIFKELGEDYRCDWANARFYHANSLEEFMECREIYQAVNDRNSVAWCDLTIGMDFYEDEQAWVYFERSLAIFIEMGDLVSLGTAYYEIAPLSEDRIFELHNEGLRCFEAVGDRWSAARFSSVVANEAIDRENFPEAEHQIERMHAAAEDFGDRTLWLHYYRNQAYLARAKGEYDQADYYSMQAYQLATQMPYNPVVHWFPIYVLCRVALSKGDTDWARRHLKDLLPILSKVIKNDWHQYITRYTIHALSLLAMQMGLLEQAGVFLGMYDAHSINGKGHNSRPSRRIRREYDQALQIVRSALGEEAFSAALQVGRAMQIEQVIEVAQQFLASK